MSSEIECSINANELNFNHNKSPNHVMKIMDGVNGDIGVSYLMNEAAIRESVESAVKKEFHNLNRKKNLVLYNVQESCKKTSIDQDDEDKANVEDLFENGVKVNNFGAIQTIRLGNRTKLVNAKPRPLLVKLKDEFCSRKILYNAVGLKYCNNSWMRNVGITVELSKSELEVDRKLRIELNRRRESGDKSWLIREGNLIKKSSIW